MRADVRRPTADIAAVELKGPAGIRRWAPTRMIHREVPCRLVGEALVPPSSAAVIEWSLTALPDGSTVVRVSIAVSPWRRDRMVLALGGRRWMSRRLRDALDRLAAHVAVRIGELRPPVHGS